MDIVIDKEFQELLSALKADKYKDLEDSIVRAGGPHNALILWNGTLIDGHNRYEICKKHNLPYQTREVSEKLETRCDVLDWMTRTAFASGREIPIAERVELAEKNRARLAEQAKQRQREHGGTAPGKSLPLNSAEVNQKRPETRDQLCEMAGVKRDTYDKLTHVLKSPVVSELKEMLEKDEISVHSAHAVTKAPVAEQRKIVRGGAEAVKEFSKTQTAIKQKAKDTQPKYLSEMRALILDLYIGTRKEWMDVNYIALQKQVVQLKTVFVGHFGE